MPEPLDLPTPHCTGQLIALLGGGWTLERCLMPMPDGARPEVEALVSPNGRHAWPRWHRAPVWWLTAQPH